MIARPTVEQERWLLLADRYPGLRAAADLHDRGGGWKTSTWWARILGFLLGLLATSLLSGVLWVLPARWLVGGVLLMVAAEWLVARRRVYRSGVEEAVYMCGAVCVVVQILDWSTGNNAAAGCALIATAVLLVGWRLLNPVLTTLALAGYSLAIALSGEIGYSNHWDFHMAAIFCAALALMGLLAGARQWRRPSHDRMCDGVVMVMPWLAYAWLMAHDWTGRSGNYLALAVALCFCIVWCFVGALRRSHPPLIGALGSLVCVACSLHYLLPWSAHWQLIAGGAVLLLVAIVLERVLRDRKAGITSSALFEPDGIDIAQFAGAAHLVPAAGPAPAEPVQGQGGAFAGGGASGRF
jgi:hypothetical protein